MRSERAKPGLGRVLNTQKLKNYGDSHAYMTPKRFRGAAFPEASPAHDPEIITELLDGDGGIQGALDDVVQAQEKLDAATDPEEIEERQADLADAQDMLPGIGPEPVPIERPEDDPVLEVQLQAAEAISEQGFAEGQVRSDGA